jgi:hypothetical protein
VHCAGWLHTFQKALCRFTCCILQATQAQHLTDSTPCQRQHLWGQEHTHLQPQQHLLLDVTVAQAGAANRCLIGEHYSNPRS